jgi:hypothetical protein
MENIFINLTIPMYYFNFNMSFNISDDLFYDLYSYLYVNLEHENYQTLRWDLNNALKTNANGEYI